MNTSALIMLLTAEGIVAAFTLYFFIKVLKTPPKPNTGVDHVEEDEHRTFRYDAT